MAKKIIWSAGARQERKDILDFWKFHNQSGSFSIKLNSLINETVDYISNFPKTGRLSNRKDMRTMRVYNYLLIYQENEAEIYILSLWGGRQNPERLKKRLE
jgi:plasmid stabilization system protein ParE